MNCPDCERPMDESMDKKHECFTCHRCGFEVHRSSWVAMDRYWLKEKYNKYTNLIIWQKLKELKKGKGDLRGENMVRKQIDHMMYDNGVTRESNTILHNFNRSVTKINEIIDVLNELTTPVIAKAETERTLWINQHCAVIEFCCDELKECIIYYNIVLYTDYEKGTTTGMLETRKLNSAGKLIIKHINKCPYCGASIKCKEKFSDALKQAAKLVKDIGFSEEDLKDIVEILKR